MIYIYRNGDILAYFSSFSLLFLFLCKLNNVHILLTTPTSIHRTQSDLEADILYNTQLFQLDYEANDYSLVPVCH